MTNNNEYNISPQWGKAALVRLATLPIALLILAGGIVPLIRFADTGFPPLFAGMVIGYFVLWVAPLSVVTYFIWRKAGHIDQTWDKR